MPSEGFATAIGISGGRQAIGVVKRAGDTSIARALAIVACAANVCTRRRAVSCFATSARRRSNRGTQRLGSYEYPQRDTTNDGEASGRARGDR